MIAVCQEHDRKLMYAEELCFAPKYERVRKLVRRRRRRVDLLHAPVRKALRPAQRLVLRRRASGGGALMDMGCHGFAWFRWMLGGRREALSVYAHMQTRSAPRRPDPRRRQLRLHRRVRRRRDRRRREQLGEARRDGGSRRGLRHRRRVYADLFMGNAALTYSEKGYGYAMEKAGTTQGWTFTIFEEAFNQGYPQELRHFIDCVRDDKPPVMTGEDGRAVLEMRTRRTTPRASARKSHCPFTGRCRSPSICGSDWRRP